MFFIGISLAINKNDWFGVLSLIGLVLVVIGILGILWII
jgi:hypothetical protein